MHPRYLLAQSRCRLCTQTLASRSFVRMLNVVVRLSSTTGDEDELR
jgi:hypothetical protein